MKRPVGTRIEIIDKNAPAITVKNLHKSFHLPTEQAFGLKQAIFNRLRGVKGYREQKVLKGLDFEIKQGEFLGIVGIPDIKGIFLTVPTEQGCYFDLAHWLNVLSGN